MAFNGFVGTGFYLEERMRGVLVVIVSLLVAGTSPARADDYVLTIKTHQFNPAEIKVPANQRVAITVINEDATPEEFESSALKVEKVVAGKSRAVVRIGPLKPGRYPFIGEYTDGTAYAPILCVH